MPSDSSWAPARSLGALRPLATIEILDRALWAVASRPGAAYAVAAPVSILVALVYLAWVHLSAQGELGTTLLWLAPLAAAALVARHVAHHLVAASLFGDSVESAIEGDADIGTAIRASRERLVRIAATGALRGAVLCASLAFFVVPAVLVWPRLLLVVPLGLFERKFGPRALREAWTRIEEAGLQPFSLAAALLVGAAAAAVDLFLAVPLAIHLLDTVLGRDLAVAMRVIEADVPFALHVAGAAVFVLVDPALPVVATLLYLDLRVRSEGLDMRLRLDRILAGQEESRA